MWKKLILKLCTRILNCLSLLFPHKYILLHYVTSRKVAGSNTEEVDFFNLPNPSRLTMALGSAQPVTEMSTRNSPGG
jgi:hypothetical protein